MADFDTYRPIAGTTDYLTKYDDFITEMQAYATEEENAREGETDILANLNNNYINYTLAADIDGDSAYKCINMEDGVNSQDYITINQANSLSGSIPTSIEDLDVGTLQANDILVVNSTGSAITGRSTIYTNIMPNPLEANGNYDMNLSGAKIVYLPIGNPGTVVSFADIAGNITPTNKLTITPDGTEKIMGQAAGEVLEIDDYPFCSFDLVYTNAAFGWTLARLQR